MGNMSDYSGYKQLIANIKRIALNGVSTADREVLIDLLRTLTYFCEFRILRQCYDKDPEIKNLIPEIDSKLEELEKTISNLEEKLVKDGALSEFEQIKLTAQRVTYKRYSEIRSAIINRSFDHYVDFMNENIDNTRQIIAVCTSVLADADLDYVTKFDINGNEKTTFDVMYDLNQQSELRSELEKYFKRTAGIDVDCEQQLKDDELFLHYIDLIKKNESLVRDYMNNLRRAGNSEDKSIALREEIARDKLRLADINSSVLAGLKNSRERNFLSKRIENNESELKRIEYVLPRLAEIYSELSEVGLKSILDQFASTTANMDTSVEQRVVDELKMSMRKARLDTKELETRTKEEIKYLRLRLKTHEHLVNDSYNSLSSYGKELVSKYPTETKKIIDVLNSKTQGSVNPVLAAFVLKALASSKKLPFRALNEMTSSYDKAGIEALVSSYEAIVHNTVKNVRESIEEVSNRAPYDVTEFENLHIK